MIIIVLKGFIKTLSIKSKFISLLPYNSKLIMYKKDFEEIRPFYDSEINAVLKKLINNKPIIY